MFRHMCLTRTRTRTRTRTALLCVQCFLPFPSLPFPYVTYASHMALLH
jgi:hypothetical protein